VGASPQVIDVRRHVENYAKEKKLRDIRIGSVFESKPGDSSCIMIAQYILI
jgi:hypothetical protein